MSCGLVQEAGINVNHTLRINTRSLWPAIELILPSASGVYECNTGLGIDKIPTALNSMAFITTVNHRACPVVAGGKHALVLI